MADNAVPEFTALASKKLAELQRNGYRITGYCFERDAEGTRPQRGFIDSWGFVGWWRPEMMPDPTPQPMALAPMTADDIREPKNGQQWRVEWWNESCRMMLPKDSRLDSFQSYKNGTLMFTIKKGDRHA